MTLGRWIQGKCGLALLHKDRGKDVKSQEALDSTILRPETSGSFYDIIDTVIRPEFFQRVWLQHKQEIPRHSENFVM